MRNYIFGIFTGFIAGCLFWAFLLLNPQLIDWIGFESHQTPMSNQCLYLVSSVGPIKLLLFFVTAGLFGIALGHYFVRKK